MPEVSIGSEFAGYRIESVAGEGGMGRVYRATQTALKRRVALKLIVPELADDADFRARFERESHLLASIEHPNVIPVYEAGEAEGRLFIVMRWVEGTDLRTVIATAGRLDPDRAVSIVEQVAAALDAAHSGGLVHRDVKPANVMLTTTLGQEHAYLMDFGLTKKTASDTQLTRTGHFVGTPDYMPPEQIRGERADARSDVYALGCMLFHALTGRPPYERESEVAKMYAHLHDPPPPVAAPGAPAGLDPVIARALAKDPEERYPSAGDLGRAARAAFSGAVPSQPERSLATGLAAPTVSAPAERVAATPTPPLPPPVTPAPTAASPTPAAPPAPPTPASERPRRRALPVALAVLLALGAAGGALAAAGVFSGSDDGGQSPPAKDEPVRNTPPKAVATIPAGNGPDGISVDGSIVWVANSAGNTLTRLDTESNKRLGDQVPVGRNPDEVDAADGFVWVANTDDGTVTRLQADPDPGDSATVPVGAGPEGLSLGEQLVWVANGDDDTVTRIDRASAEPVGTPIGVGNKPIGIFVGEDNVWVTNSFSGTVTRIDPSTAALKGSPVPVGKNIRAVTEGLGFAWVSSVDEDTVTRLDLRSGQVVGEPIQVGDRPKEMAVAGGLIWVVNEGSGSVSRIDPANGRVVGKPIRVGRKPVGIAAGAGSLWVANNASDTVTRIDP
jgi:DNA-binding beta-propeller fold protein YncE/tRNA A-37 threonylcarbamoyl transferase component Bud32